MNNEPKPKLWTDYFRTYNWMSSFDKCMFFLRLLIILLAITMCILNATTGFTLPFSKIDCMWDGLHWLTESANDYFLENLMARNVLLISSSFIIDALLLNFAYRYIFWGKTWRPMLFICVFYILRILCQRVF